MILKKRGSSDEMILRKEAPQRRGSSEKRILRDRKEDLQRSGSLEGWIVRTGSTEQRILKERTPTEENLLTPVISCVFQCNQEGEATCFDLISNNEAMPYVIKYVSDS
jgi:hypothetical protein